MYFSIYIKKKLFETLKIDEEKVYAFMKKRRKKRNSYLSAAVQKICNEKTVEQCLCQYLKLNENA